MLFRSLEDSLEDSQHPAWTTPAGLHCCNAACLSVYLSVCLSVYLSVCLPVCLFTCLSVSLSVCLVIVAGRKTEGGYPLRHPATEQVFTNCTLCNAASQADSESSPAEKNLSLRGGETASNCFKANNNKTIPLNALTHRSCGKNVKDDTKTNPQPSKKIKVI